MHFLIDANLPRAAIDVCQNSGTRWNSHEIMAWRRDVE
jgi:hypothetical protein